jgi:hypothetical protein
MEIIIIIIIVIKVKMKKKKKKTKRYIQTVNHGLQTLCGNGRPVQRWQQAPLSFLSATFIQTCYMVTIM